MRFVQTLIIRLVLSVFLAILIGRFFFQGASIAKVLGLAAVMFGLAYVFQYTKKRDQEEDHGK